MVFLISATRNQKSETKTISPPRNPDLIWVSEDEIAGFLDFCKFKNEFVTKF